MSVPTLIKNIRVQNSSVQLYLVNDKPIVNFKDQSFSQVWPLVQAMPILCDPVIVHEFAEIGNFLWKGTEFAIVHSISDFQKDYLDRVNFELEHPADILPYRVTDYAIFDVSTMHPAVLENGQLKFFTYNTTNGIPFKVACPFPYVSTSTFVHYQLLPILNQTKLKH